MTNRKTTKRALFSSVISLILCLSMLVGTTFAWFTDSVSSGVNQIVAGNLDVELEYSSDLVNWNDATDAKDLFVAPTGSTKGLWEPGHTEVAYLRVRNNGSLALKYNLKVAPYKETVGKNEKGEDIVLSQYLKYTAVALDSESAKLFTRAEAQAAAMGSDTTMEQAISQHIANDTKLEPGKEHWVALVVYMPETVGNEANYRGETAPKIEFAVTLLATQEQHESDSFGIDYDKDAMYPGVSTSTEIDGSNGVYNDITLTAGGDNPVSAKLTADLVHELANNGNTQVQLIATDMDVDASSDPVVVTYADVGLYENGKEVDLTGNTKPIEVKLYVGTAYADQTATVKHDGEVIAVAKVAADGYVTYNTLHFCQVTVDIAANATADKVIVDAEEGETVPNETPVQMLVGSHYYTVSYGMSQSWDVKSEKDGQVMQAYANVYIPEDLLAYSLMYKNGDLGYSTGRHCQLTLQNDLDFTNVEWEPIGRFYTDILGNGKKISNLNDSLLGCVYDCQVKDLTLENVNASGSASGVVAKELAGDIVLSNVVIAGENTVTYKADSKTNWPEGGSGVGAICGVSLIGSGSAATVDVTVTGKVTVNYEGGLYGNTTNLKTIGFDKNFGLNVYMKNVYQGNGVVLSGGSIETTGEYYVVNKISDGLYQDAITTSKYYVFNKAGLLSANALIAESSTGEGRGMKFNLLNDVDLAGETWKSIDKMWIDFDGNGHTISNLTTEAWKAGFFGYLGGGSIKNLTLENVNVTGAQAGAFAGSIEGTIDNCVLKGENTITWKEKHQYDDPGKDVEAWSGIGAITGITQPCTVNATIAEGTTVVLNKGTMTTKASYVDDLTGYIGTNKGTVVNNGTVISRESIADGLDHAKAVNTYFVSNANGLETLNAKMADKSAGKNTIVDLEADIDFAGKTWTPVDSHADTKFTLKEINGNGHTISNLTVNGQAMFTRFAGSGDVTVKDITFDNATINSTKLNSSILTVQSYQNVLLDNVDVTNSTITGGYKVAPLIATVYNESSSTVTATLKNCDVSNTVVKATSYDFCTTGMVAFVNAGNNDKVEFENCTVTDVKLYAPDDSYKAHAAIYTTGSSTLFNEAEGVTVTNVTFEII